MPNPNQPNLNPEEVTNIGETTNQTPRETYEERGEKGYNAASEQENNRELGQYSVAEIAAMDPSEIRAKFSREEILAVKARLEREYAERYGVEQVAQAEVEAVSTSEPEAKPVVETEAVAAQAEESVNPETSGPDLSGIDTVVVDGDSTVSPTAETVPLVIPVITPEDVPSSTETITAEELAQTKEKAKQKSSIKNIFAKKVLPVVLTAAVLVGGLVGFNAIGKDSGNQAKDETPDQTPTEQVDQAQASGETREQHGIKDGYYETGEFMSTNKGTPYDFANAAEVASVVGDDECEVMKEVAHNQSESLADQLACIPDTVKAKYGVSSDFLGGKSIKETEKMVEQLSDEDYDKLIHQVDQIWDDAFTEKVTLNGEYQNAFMRTSATGNERVTHNNTELVACTTQENGTAATRFYWTTDDNANSPRMGDVIAKIARDDAGHIAQGEGVGSCTQIVTEVGTFSFLYDGMTVIPHDPDHPDRPTPPDVPPEPTPPGPTPEWGKSGDPHSGPNRLPSDLVDPNSEITQAENDAANRGNQGYIDDNQATPGSASENNGINENRLWGGEQQGGEAMNGANPNAPTQEQLARDEAGNAAQEAAQEAGNTPGGDNNSNAAEEAAVAGGNF